MMDANWFKQSDTSPFGTSYEEEFAVPEKRTSLEINSILHILSGYSLSSSILDLAAGRGRITVGLQQAGYTNVYALDLNSRQLSSNPADYKALSDMRVLPFASDSLDVVLLMFTSFGYFDDIGNVSTLREIQRVLVPGGKVIIDMSNFDRINQNFLPERALQLPSNDNCRKEVRYFKTLIPGTSSVNYPALDPVVYLHEKRTLVTGAQTSELSPIILRVYQSNQIPILANLAGFSSCILSDSSLLPFDPQRSRRMWVQLTK